MKPLDLLLLSLAVGLTAFTAWVFGSPPADAGAVSAAAPADALGALLEDHPLKNPAFGSVVIHHSATHGGSGAAFEKNHRARLGGLAYHFVIGNGSGTADGLVEAGYRWKDQVAGPHTKNQEINLSSIGICLVGDLTQGPPTRKQTASLVDLLERLCRAGRIPPDRILCHREADPETLCPGRFLPMDAIRAAVASRLGAPLTRK
jgi:N-acetyl-anhydromuramyl-L-alanine amidase AmpD